MDDNNKDQAAAHPSPVVSHCITRMEEMEAVLAALNASWGAISDAQRRHIVSDVRRGLLDTTCDLEAETASRT